jgi:hypothetical protein
MRSGYAAKTKSPGEPAMIDHSSKVRLLFKFIPFNGISGGRSVSTPTMAIPGMSASPWLSR